MGPFTDVLRALADTGRRFVVVGGVAAVMQGAHRATYDLDLVVELDTESCRAIVDALVGLGYKPIAPVDPYDFVDETKRDSWAETKHMIVFSFWDTTERRAQVDLFIRYPLAFDRLWGNAAAVSIDGRDVRVAAPRELIEMKRAIGREQDLADIAVLEKLEGSNG